MWKYQCEIDDIDEGALEGTLADRDRAPPQFRPGFAIPGA
jgi:hypothetical protein